MNHPRLNSLPVGTTARISHLDAAPGIRRRLLDIGLTPGVPLTCLFAGPSGDPRAYFVRGAIIALRKEDAQRVLLEKWP